MVTRNALLATVAPLLAALVITVPSVAQKARLTPGHFTSAVMTEAPLGVPLVFGVEGLMKDNVDEVTRSLTSLTEGVYVCPRCRHVESAAGLCTSCDIQLEAKQEPVLFHAAPSFEMASIRLTPFAARTLSYSALVAALAKSSVEIDGAKFPLSGTSCLVLSGGSSQNVEALEEALDAAGFFESAMASYDPVSTEIHIVVHAVASPPMRDEVAGVIDALDTEATLVDVIWGPQPVPAKT